MVKVCEALCLPHVFKSVALNINIPSLLYVFLVSKSRRDDLDSIGTGNGLHKSEFEFQQWHKIYLSPPPKKNVQTSYMTQPTSY